MGLLDHYKEWVRNNAAQIGFIDNALTSLTWLLPDRFSGTEFTAEAIDASLALLRLFNDSILQPPPNTPGVRMPLPWPFWLAVVREVQVLAEIGANNLEKRGLCSKYDPLTLLEALKAALRYLLLYKGGGRILTGGGLWDPEGQTGAAQQREQHEAAIVAAFARLRRLHGLPDIPQYRGQSAVDGDQTARGSGSAPAALPRCEQQVYLQHVEDHFRRERVRADQMLVAGEYLHVIRPLLYVLALRRWGRTSWTPWLASLALDVISLQLIRRGAEQAQQAALAAAAAVNGPQLTSPNLAELYNLRSQRWTDQEERELLGRKWLLSIYAARSPFYDNFTRRGVAAVERGLRPVPLIGWGVSKGVEILNGIQQYYTYTSAS